MNWRHWLSIGLASFAGGAVAWISAHLAAGLPTSSEGVEAFALGACVAGASAVAHLLQPVPVSPPPAPPAPPAPTEIR